MPGPTPMRRADLPPEINAVTGQIVDAAITVQREIGPGHREDLYKACLEIELRSRGLQAVREFPIQVRYRGFDVGAPIRADFLVDGRVIVEVKATSAGLDGRDWAQTLSYVQMSRRPVGLLINFHDFPLKRGIQRILSPVLPPSPATSGTPSTSGLRGP